MPIRSRLRTLWSRAARFASFAAAAALATRAAFGAASVFPHPDRIRYDGQCLTIDGKDVFIYSAAFHYFRCPPELWRERFRRLKEAGCNAVETYVPWNWSERTAPANPADFSHIDLAEFQAWLHMAQDEFGFYTIIRPGPYICAEWDGGGFPRWLLARRPAALPLARPWLRTSDSRFLEWSRHWMQAVCPVIAAGQVTRRPPGHGGVILVQIENEFDFDRAVPDADRVPALRALYEAALAGGIEVPIFTCWTRQCRDSADPELAQVFDACNAYPRFDIQRTADSLTTLESQQPDAPAMLSEWQGGWFEKVGGVPSDRQPGITAAQLSADALEAIQSGATILNCYMGCGGTNFGRWAARDIATTYDYDAPIRETGAIGEKYRAFAAIGQFLRQYGADLARSEALSCQVESGNPDVVIAARQTRSGTVYVFASNRSVSQSRRGTAALWLEGVGEVGVDYDLAPFGFKVLRLHAKGGYVARGYWLPDAVPAVRRPDPHLIPAPIVLREAQVRIDRGAVAADGKPFELGPRTLLPELGVTDARPVVYSAAFDGRGDGMLHFTLPLADELVVEVNGRVIGAADSNGDLPAAGLPAGPNALRILYYQRGQPNGGAALDYEPGILAAQWRPRGGGAPLAIRSWTVVPAFGGEAQGWTGLGPGAAVGWRTVALVKGESKPAPNPPASSLSPLWYRLQFELPAPNPKSWVPWGAKLSATGDGELWLNGHPLGRYWLAGPQRIFYLPECWLRSGPGAAANVLTVVLAPTHGAARLLAAAITPYAAQAEAR